MKLQLFFLASIMITFPGCKEGNIIGQETNTKKSEAISLNANMLQDVVASNNRFALDLYKHLRAQDTGNLFVSPLSLHTTLTLAYNGALGKTKSEMGDVLYVSGQEPQALGKSYSEVTEQLVSNDTIPGIDLLLANAFWIQQDYPLKDSFRLISKKYYNTELNHSDFIDQPARSSQRINEWVSEKTRGYIDYIISPNYFTDRTRLVISNAIYFNGMWADVFDKDKTEKDVFFGQSNQEDSVEFMNKTHRYGYFENETLKAINIPYKNNRLSMCIFLPKQGKDLASLEQKMTHEQINHWLQFMETNTVKVSIPKFENETQYDLNEILSRMGMQKAFSRIAANFKGISPRVKKEPIYIKNVTQKAIIEIKEKRSVATAVTLALIEQTAIPDDQIKIKDFIANRPFIYLIKDNEHNMILFIGNLVNLKT